MKIEFKTLPEAAASGKAGGQDFAVVLNENEHFEVRGVEFDAPQAVVVARYYLSRDVWMVLRR